MFENLNSVFQETLKLAQIREMFENEYNGDEIVKVTREYLFERTSPQTKSAEKNLIKYLMAQEHETIKILMTIMYLGRDRDYESIKEPGKRFKTLYDVLSPTFKSKEIDIVQMVSKVPLGSYLKHGFEILEVNIS